MALKPLGNEPPMAVRNCVNQPKTRAALAPIKNMSVPEKMTTEEPVRNSVQKKRFGSSPRSPK
jgi:hypothetical protein